MFVQEEKIFAGKVLRLHICASDGAEWLEEATEDTSVEKLKERCLKHCAHGSLEDPKSVTHHKLIHAASERVLSDAKTILEENIQDQDVLLLIKKRAPSPLPKMADVSAEEKKKQEEKAPDREAIFRATANLPSYNMDRAEVQTNIRDFQTELRKILVSLIEVAQKLLALNPDAVELFKKANAMLDEEEDGRVDEAALRQLTEMGFPESRAAKALRLNHMSVPQAMEWLIEHAEDPTIDTPLPGQASPGGAEAAPEAASEAAGTSTGDEEPRDELTEIFKKIRRKREFRADARVRAPGPGHRPAGLAFVHVGLRRVEEAGPGEGLIVRPRFGFHLSSCESRWLFFLQILICHLKTHDGPVHVPAVSEPWAWAGTLPRDQRLGRRRTVCGRGGGQALTTWSWCLRDVRTRDLGHLALHLAG
uniref:UBA domain-containing protein n=1 Tax=Felis catus TaxID=9685 RepID=A0ABI8AEG8_FELCA